MQHLQKKTESFKRNYPLEHLKQLRKHWKGVAQEEKERLIVENVEETFEFDSRTKLHNKEEKRRSRMFNLVVGLNQEADIEACKNLRLAAIEYWRSVDDTTFIDSLLFPSLDQISSIPRFALHNVGKIVFKIVNDLNFSKLFNQLELKSKVTKDSNSIQSKKKSSKKVSSQKEAEKSQKGKEESLQNTPVTNNSNKNDDSIKKEFENVCREIASGGDSEWLTTSKPKAGPKPRKRRSNDYTKYSGHSRENQAPPTANSKAYSLRDHEPESLDRKKASSSTNNGPDDEFTRSINQTLSTKTESMIMRSLEVNNLYSKPEIEVRHEDEMSNEDTISRTSKRGSVDRMQNSSVDRLDKNLRTNSNELKVRKKSNNHNKVFKQFQRTDLPLKPNPGFGPAKDRKEPNKIQLVNLYSEQSIKDIMNNAGDRPKKRGLKQKNELSPLDPEALKANPTLEKRGSGNQLKQEEAGSPLATKKSEKKVVYSTVVSKLSKWEVDELDGQPRNPQGPIKSLDFDEPEPPEAMIADIPKKVDLKKGFQKYLSGPMSLEQGELFFKNYLNFSINDSVSRIKSAVNSQEPLRIVSFKRIRHVITQSFKTIKSSLMVYGSWVTGLMTETSDIDLCIKRHEVLDRNEIKNILETLEANFRAFKWVREVKGIYGAMVPVLKLVLSAHQVVDPRTDFAELADGTEVNEDFRARFLQKADEDLGCPALHGACLPISVDITVNDLSVSENVGLRTTQFVQRSLQFFPLLGDLALFFKTFLFHRSLSNSYKGTCLLLGGLGSYATCLLIIAYLEFRKKTKKEDTISDVVSGMLNFYGTEFNPATHGICTNSLQEE